VLFFRNDDDNLSSLEKRTTYEVSDVPIVQSQCPEVSQHADVLQFSASTDDYFIPGIHVSPDVESMNKANTTRPQLIVSNDESQNMQDLNYSIPSTFGSSVGSNKQFLSDSESDSTSEQSFSILADLGITDEFIGIKEDHFSSDVS
jgi:hypothetical protein